MNLPAGCTEEMVDAQCSPIANNMGVCGECIELHPVAEMYPWKCYDRYHREYLDIYLCEACVPRCGWLHNENGFVNLDLKPCGRIQSPTAQGPWCAEHEREFEALDEMGDIYG